MRDRPVRYQARHHARLDEETAAKLEELAAVFHRTRSAILRHVMQWGLTQTQGWTVDRAIPPTGQTLHLLLDPTLLQQVQEAAAAYSIRMAVWVREAVPRVTPEDMPESWRAEGLETRSQWLMLALLGTTLLGFVAGWFVRGLRHPAPSIQAQTPLVTRVLDGDILELSTGEQVRLIGVDLPETQDPRQPAAASGREAPAFTRQLVEGKHIRLEFDVQRRDPSQRLLAYVYVGEVMLNAELVRQGYAQVATFAPNVKYQGWFLKLQREAREARRGVWRAP